MKVILFLFVLVFLCRWIHALRNPKHPHVLNVYFGVPGSGKTTFAAYLTREALRESLLIRLCRRWNNPISRKILAGGHWKRRINVYSNVPLRGAYILNARTDLGNYLVEDGKLIIDEAGVEFNNRNYKAFPPEAIKFFKYHRHYGMSVDVFSQSHEDMDVTLRRLAQNLFVVKRSVIPFFIVIKRIRRKVGIDETSHQIVDAYSFGFPVLDSKHVFMPPLWKMFDSYEHDDLPKKEWHIWGGDGLKPIDFDAS